MTLGLAIADRDGIHLAIERQGVPAPGILHRERVLVSKMVRLQAAPEVVALAAGGTEHWADLQVEYKPQAGVAAAAAEVQRVFSAVMGSQNEAYALVCGFAGGSAKCYRVNRGQHQAAADEPIPEDLSGIVCIGMADYGREASTHATQAMAEGTAPAAALAEAIRRLMPRDRLTPPVDEYVLRPPKSRPAS